MTDLNTFLTMAANVTIVVGFIAGVVWAIFQGGQFVAAVIALKNDVPALRIELAELRRGQEHIIASQEQQRREMSSLKRKFRWLWKDVGNLRSRLLGQGQTHTDMPPVHPDDEYDDAVLDELAEDDE